MKKNISFFCLLTVVVGIALMTCMAEATYSPEVGDGYLRFDFNQITGGIVNHKQTATVEKDVEIDGINAVKFTPMPTSEDSVSTKFFTLDCYSLANFDAKVEVPKYKYVGITYYYQTEEPTFAGKSKLYIVPGATKATGYLQAAADKPMVTNQWVEAIFSFNSTMELSENAVDPWINQMQFEPFDTTAPSSLKSTDVLYIAYYTFYENNPDPNYKAVISFDAGDPGANGEMESLALKPGEKYTLPTPVYTFDEYDAKFMGWKSSADSKIHPAGTEFTTEDSVGYTAMWELITNVEFVSLDFTEYEDGIVNHRDTATIEIVELDGKNAVKIVPNPTSTQDDEITIDGFSYSNAGIDLGVFKYFAIEYKYVSPNPITDPMSIYIMTNGGMFAPGKGANATALEGLKTNEWTTAVFDFSFIDNTILNPDLTVHNMKQMHICPLGISNLSSLSSEDVVYISRVMFFREKPTFEEHTAYMTGYSDGSFKPNKTMTRAEACTVVARLMDTEENIAKNTTTAFTDVAADKWYTKYISFCEAKGLLKSYSGTFLPEQNITRAEFAELVYNMGLAKEDAANKKTFTDVTEAHPKYNAIMAAASAGLIGGYEDGTFLPDRTITRAQVVTIINRAKGTSKSADAVSTELDILFTDVDGAHWAFADIAEATVTHREMFDKWVDYKDDPMLRVLEHIDVASIMDVNKGNAKVKELDELQAKRVSEIRSTSNMDISAFSGTKYYVSVNGSDSNDGSSPEKALKSVKKAATLAKVNDVILLERGGLWREKIKLNAGVTITAYGEGAKPVLYGSPENGANAEKWALVYKDDATGAKIWKYANAGMTDVGNLYLKAGDWEGYAYKEIPNCVDDEFFLRSDNTVAFDYKKELDRNFEFFHKANSSYSGGIIDPSGSVGPLYFRCDNGNPGDVFDTIEFNTRGNLVIAANNVTVDNLCLMFTGSHGIGVGTVKNLKVTNCELGWIGGSVQTYSYGGVNGKATRFGNGIEVYGGCDNYVVDNCYLYQCYDAAVTHQYDASGQGDIVMDNITYSNNVITDCIYSIEYFHGDNAGYKRSGNNVLFEGNLMRRAGFGFGSTRPDGGVARHIRSGNHSSNPFKNYLIKNNIFDRSEYELFQTYTTHKSYIPKLEGNVFIQGIGNRIYIHGVPASAGVVNLNTPGRLRRFVGDTTSEFYFVENIPTYEYNMKLDKTVDKEYPVVEDKVVEQVLPEDGEVKEPYMVKTAMATINEDKTKSLYGASMPNEATNVEFMMDSEHGLLYAHVTPENFSDYVFFDCWGLSPIPVENNMMVVKLFVRTNYKETPAIYCYNNKDKDENAVTASFNSNAIKALKANEEWEEVYIVANGINSEIAFNTHIQMCFWGGTVKGVDFFNADGSEKYPGAYIDVAAWAVFPNQSSAMAFGFDELKEYIGA